METEAQALVDFALQKFGKDAHFIVKWAAENFSKIATLNEKIRDSAVETVLAEKKCEVPSKVKATKSLTLLTGISFVYAKAMVDCLWDQPIQMLEAAGSCIEIIKKLRV